MKKRERALALIIAGLFFASSVGVVGLTVWTINAQNDNQDMQNSLETTQASIDEQQNQEPKEGQLQGTKLADFTTINEVKELRKVDLKKGDGETAKADSTVTAHYTGALAKDGTIFESSKDGGQPATFPLNQVIKGWQEGVPGMKVGGTRRLIIPAELAYGEQSPSPNIPPNSDLVFDIELISIE